MYRVDLPERGTFEAWRDAARRLAGAGVPAAQVTWSVGTAGAGLFDGDPLPGGGAALTVPKAFIDLAQQVICHRDPEAPGLLFALLFGALLLADYLTSGRCPDELRALDPLR